MPLPRSSRLAALCFVLLVGACAMPPGGPDASPDSPWDSSSGSWGHSPEGRAAPLSARDLAADPRRFNGLPASQVTAALGEPNYRRREAPAEIWQYYGPGCVLDLFLYDEQGAQRVTHFELRNQSQLNGAACLRQLLEGQRRLRSS